MKKINFAILFFAISSMMLMVYYGCKKDNSDPVENSDGNIHMTVNGAAWSPTTLYASKSGQDMVLYGIDGNGKEFGIKLGSVATGSFVTGENNGCLFFDGQNYYRTGDLGTDTIVITSLDNNMIEGEFDLLLIKQSSEQDKSGYIQLKGDFHVEKFLNNPYGWDRGKVTFYKTDESCSETEVRINMFYKGGASNGTPIAGPPPFLRFSCSDIPECEYGGYNLDMPPLNNRFGFDFRILREGDYMIQLVLPDENMNWTKIIGEDVIKIEKQKCILYEVKCDTGKMIKVITKPVTGITDNSAITGGEISYDGTDPIDITSRGVEYVAINPNYGESHTDDGSGLGEFISNLTDLHSITEYKVRAYCYDFERGHYYYGDWIAFQTTGGGGGNQSIITLTSDDYTVTLYPLFVGIQPSGVLAIIDTNLVGIIPHSFGFALSENEVLAVTSYDFNRPCNIPQAFDRTIQYAINDYIIWQNVFVVPCPDWEHSQAESNGTLNISALTNNMISGTFNATLADINETGGYDFKCFTGTFTLYNSEEQHRISSINDFNHNSSSDFKIMKSE